MTLATEVMDWVRFPASCGRGEPTEHQATCRQLDQRLARLPGREVGGEIVPGATSAQHVEDGVEDAPRWVHRRSAACRSRQEVALDALPLSVSQVASIPCAHARERMTVRHVGAFHNTLSF